MRGIYHLYPFMEIPNCNEDYSESLQGNIPCYDLYRKIIALRVYFSLIIINFFFITSTTTYFIYRNLSAKWYDSSLDRRESVTPNQTISKQWQTYSLRKKGLFGPVLGAIGHLIFSSAVLLYQVIVTNFTCDIYLWGPLIGFFIWTYAIVWRTFRLHFLIRLNELRQKYAKQNAISYNNNRSNTESTKQNDKDYVWFMKHENNSFMISISRQIYAMSACLIVIVTIIILAESLGIWVTGISTCEFYMGNYMILAMVVFFFAVVVPFIFWYLRGDDDAHGIRKEIWMTMGVGVPCFIICIIWQVLFEYPTDSKPAGLRGVFGPSNWLIIVTTTYHIMSIIMPVFKTLSIDSRKNSLGKCVKNCCHRKSSVISNNSAIAKILHPNHLNSSSATLQSSIAISNHHWELTTDSLHLALLDPVTLDVLKNWAVKDFSIENILFYDYYLQLVHLIDRSNYNQQNKTEKESYSVHSQEQLDLCHESIVSQSPTLSRPNAELLNIPFSTDQIPDVVDFYNTFIVDQSPLQVNISYRARKRIEIVLKPVIDQFRQNNRNPTKPPVVITRFGIPSFLQPSKGLEKEEEESLNESCKGFIDSSKFLSHSLVRTSTCTSQSRTRNFQIVTDEGVWTTFNSKNERSTITAITNYTNYTNLTLEIFETARKEVFWNVFTGLFPKIVEAYNTNCNN